MFFVFNKAFFLLYHFNKSSLLSSGEIAKVFIYGLRLDASFSAYLCIFPFLLFFLSSFIHTGIIKKAITVYTITLTIILCFLTVADAELYKAWGYRLDDTPLQYFNSPREMAATISSSPLFLLMFFFLLLSAFFIFIYIRLFKKYIPVKTKKLSASWSLLSLGYVAFLFVPIRGGLQQIPVNQSSVYFSVKMFANHAAINVPWNVMHALLNKNHNKKNPYEYFSKEKAQQYLDTLYTSPVTDQQKILNIKRPNIIFIILESYTAKFVGCLGGVPGVTPNLDSSAQDGMLFTNIYASGDRSEKGLVALMSGYPTQHPSIIITPAKTQTLPFLPKILKQEGYHSGYYYGGELEFSNIKSYLLNAGYDKLISKYDFDQKYYNSKWGVHDHILFSRLLKDLQTEKYPFFSTLFTLSSHEPYDIPIVPKFTGSDEETKFMNSFYYTDQAIGHFIREAKKQPWWDSTLIIMVADHGHRLPGDDANDKPAKFRIPLIFTGGALKNIHTINTSIGAQTDIITTLLKQLGIASACFKWGKDLLDPLAKQFAFYHFFDGFGFITPSGAITFDNVSKKIIYRDKHVPDEQLDYGKAYMQLSFYDYLKR